MQRNDFYISKLVSACLMGDGCLRKDDSGNRNRNAQLRIKQQLKHKDHLDYIAERLQPLTAIKFDYSPPIEHIIIQGKNTQSHGSYQLRTQNVPFLTAMYHRWYLNKIKRIDPHAMTLIDAEFMAIWVMQDGYLEALRTDCINQTYAIATDCFSYGDLLMARNAIIEKTGFIFNVRKKAKTIYGETTYRLYLNRKQTQMFRDYIAPYIQPSFEYKITLQQREQPTVI